MSASTAPARAGDARTGRSAALAERARAVLPGGSTRTTVFTEPQRYAARGHGCRITDADGNELIDFLANYTSLIHGYGASEVMAALRSQIAAGTAFPLPTATEIELAELLCERVASVERVWFTGSGTEAVMLAIKLARAATGRSKIAKCEGAYHGTYDPVQFNVHTRPWDGSGAEPQRSAEIDGMPAGVTQDVVVLPFNDVEAAERILRRYAGDLAAVVVDPVPNRIGLLPADPGYLNALRAITAASGTMLIFDEVLSFRVDYHGAQARYAITPDLTTFGKIIGGGLPIGAVGGRRDIMDVLDPRRGRLAHGGTFNANPLSMAAGLAAMKRLTPQAVESINALGERVRTELNATLAAADPPGCVTGAGSLLRIHLGARAVVDYPTSYQDRLGRDSTRRLYQFLLDKGVLVAPYGMACISTAMGDAEVERLAEIVAQFVSRPPDGVDANG